MPCSDGDLASLGCGPCRRWAASHRARHCLTRSRCPVSQAYVPRTPLGGPIPWIPRAVCLALPCRGCISAGVLPRFPHWVELLISATQVGCPGCFPGLSLGCPLSPVGSALSWSQGPRSPLGVGAGVEAGPGPCRQAASRGESGSGHSAGAQPSATVTQAPAARDAVNWRELEARPLCLASLPLVFGLHCGGEPSQAPLGASATCVWPQGRAPGRAGGQFSWPRSPLGAGPCPAPFITTGLVPA